MIDFEILLKLAGAFALTLPIAYDRERSQRAAGIRTFPLVSVTACGFLLIGLRFLGDEALVNNARLMQGLIGGLGFLGGGAILKTKASVKGMATATSIWCAGAIGMASAYGEWTAGFTLSLITFFTLRIGTQVKEAVDHNGGENDERPSCD
ncbi:MAG: MgtC/SapB family protein [Verrucomicrobiales bacterium]|nr:MgtC/SapB family protein [Verrucomicrobiales bacterium]